MAFHKAPIDNPLAYCVFAHIMRGDVHAMESVLGIVDPCEEELVSSQDALPGNVNARQEVMAEQILELEKGAVKPLPKKKTAWEGTING